jgi:hypothetical protein
VSPVVHQRWLVSHFEGQLQRWHELPPHEYGAIADVAAAGGSHLLSAELVSDRPESMAC